MQIATVHAAQALFLAKQMVPYAVGFGVYAVLSEHQSVCDYMHIHRFIIKKKQRFSAELPTVFIRQTFYHQSFLLYCR